MTLAAATYRQARARVSHLVGVLSTDRLYSTVPAPPAWLGDRPRRAAMYIAADPVIAAQPHTFIGSL